MTEITKPIIRLHRVFMKSIDKNYIRKKLEKRKGNCRKCGDCCRKCIYLDKNTNLCKVYENPPKLCYKDFPIDKLDQKIWKVKNCGYRFE